MYASLIAFGLLAVVGGLLAEHKVLRIIIFTIAAVLFLLAGLYAVGLVSA